MITIRIILPCNVSSYLTSKFIYAKPRMFKTKSDKTCTLSLASIPASWRVAWHIPRTRAAVNVLLAEPRILSVINVRDRARRQSRSPSSPGALANDFSSARVMRCNSLLNARWMERLLIIEIFLLQNNRVDRARDGKRNCEFR